MPKQTLLSETDLKLFKELGLAECTDIASCDNVTNSLRLRQLDKLKLVLSRISKESSVFSPEVKEGIERNDLRTFAKAVLVLNSKTIGKR
jgi:hypothetical protein